jgi:hypothetical protein
MHFNNFELQYEIWTLQNNIRYLLPQQEKTHISNWMDHRFTWSKTRPDKKQNTSTFEKDI